MNFFGLGELIEERCKSVIDTLQHTAIIYKGARVSTQYDLACYIVAERTDKSAQTNRRTENMEVQRWGVVLVINHPASQTDIRDVLKSASDPIHSILKHGNLHGWKPEGYPFELQRVPGTTIDYLRPGTISIPFIFETRFVP